MQFPSLNVPEECVSGIKNGSLMGGRFCSRFAKHQLSTLLVGEMDPEGPSCAAALMPCVSFTDANYSCVPAVAAGISFQPSQLFTLLLPASLQQQLADLLISSSLDTESIGSSRFWILERVNQVCQSDT